MAALGLARGDQNIINPEADFTLHEGDDAFVISKDPPAAF